MHRSWNMTCESFVLVSNQFKMQNKDWIALTDHRTDTDFLCPLEHKENLSKYIYFFSWKWSYRFGATWVRVKWLSNYDICISLTRKKWTKSNIWDRALWLSRDGLAHLLGINIEDMNSCFLRIWANRSEFMLKTRRNISQQWMKMLPLLT